MSDFTALLRNIGGMTHAIAIEMSGINKEDITPMEAQMIGRRAIKDIQEVGKYAIKLAEVIEIHDKLPRG